MAKYYPRPPLFPDDGIVLKVRAVIDTDQDQIELTKDCIHFEDPDNSRWYNRLSRSPYYSITKEENGKIVYTDYYKDKFILLFGRGYRLKLFPKGTIKDIDKPVYSFISATPGSIGWDVKKFIIDDGLPPISQAFIYDTFREMVNGMVYSYKPGDGQIADLAPQKPCDCASISLITYPNSEITKVLSVSAIVVGAFFLIAIVVLGAVMAKRVFVSKDINWEIQKLNRAINGNLSDLSRSTAR